MEELSEADRYKHGVIPHDLVLPLGMLAAEHLLEQTNE